MNLKMANEIELKIDDFIYQLPLLTKEEAAQELIKLANSISPVKFSGNERRGFSAFKKQAVDL